MTPHAVERDRFLTLMESEGMSRDIARRILRHANTVQRLAAAECNGVWPYSNTSVAQLCKSSCGNMLASRALVRGVCPACRAERLIREWCARATTDKDVRSFREFIPVFSGDPRGACVKLRVPSGKTDDLGRTGICVPTRRY